MFAAMPFETTQDEIETDESESGEAEVLQTRENRKPKQGKSRVQKKAKKKRVKSDAEEEEADRPLCEFCLRPSTLKIGGRYYLVSSKTRSNLKICNACKSYEHRNGVLVPRSERKTNRARKRRLTEAQEARKRMFFDPVDENSTRDVESEPEIDTPRLKRARGNEIRPFIPTPTFEHHVSWPVENVSSPTATVFMEPDDGEAQCDINCHTCSKMISNVTDLVMCCECDFICHLSCFLHHRPEVAPHLPPKQHPVRIVCAHHNFADSSFNPNQIPKFFDMPLPKTKPPRLMLSGMNGYSSPGAELPGAPAMRPRKENNESCFTPGYANQISVEKMLKQCFDHEYQQLFEYHQMQQVGSQYLLQDLS